MCIHAKVSRAAVRDVIFVRPSPFFSFHPKGDTNALMDTIMLASANVAFDSESIGTFDSELRGAVQTKSSSRCGVP